MAAPEAVDFLIEDHGDSKPPKGFRKEFAEDKPYKSLLQRKGKTLEELLQLFDWQEDDQGWMGAYSQEPPDLEEEVKYRRREAFCIGGWRDLNEDFRRNDVSCLREIRAPLVASRTPLKVMKKEFEGQ